MIVVVVFVFGAQRRRDPMISAAPTCRPSSPTNDSGRSLYCNTFSSDVLFTHARTTCEPDNRIISGTPKSIRSFGYATEAAAAVSYVYDDDESLSAFTNEPTAGGGIMSPPPPPPRSYLVVYERVRWRTIAPLPSLRRLTDDRFTPANAARPAAAPRGELPAAVPLRQSARLQVSAVWLAMKPR